MFIFIFSPFAQTHRDSRTLLSKNLRLCVMTENVDVYRRLFMSEAIFFCLALQLEPPNDSASPSIGQKLPGA